MLAVSEQADTPSWWTFAAWGGLGAFLGAGLSSFVAWKVLQDNRAARVRAEEQTATGTIVRALIQARQDSRGDDDLDWPNHALKLLGKWRAPSLL
ncbi:hypothetical protein SAMN05428939_8057 [Streptomyces sp. TLI_105]|nr:hypothetical protein SAMN05428939_8057 [Streptomyces sp. TLI_105]